MRAITSLNTRLRVSMPALRNDRSSRCCWREARREAVVLRQIEIDDAGTTPASCRLAALRRRRLEQARRECAASRSAGRGRSARRACPWSRARDSPRARHRTDRRCANSCSVLVDLAEVPGIAEVDHVRAHRGLGRHGADVRGHHVRDARARGCRAATRSDRRRDRRGGTDRRWAATRSSAPCRGRDRETTRAAR